MWVGAGGHQNQGKELTLDHRHPRAQPKDQSDATCPLADGRRQDLSHGRARRLCDTSRVRGCFAGGNTPVRPRSDTRPTVLHRHSCQRRYGLYVQMQPPGSLLFCPYRFCNQASGLNTCIHLFSIHLAISSRVSITEGHKQYQQEFASQNKSVKYL